MDPELSFINYFEECSCRDSDRVKAEERIKGFFNATLANKENKDPSFVEFYYDLKAGYFMVCVFNSIWTVVNIKIHTKRFLKTEMSTNTDKKKAN